MLVMYHELISILPIGIAFACLLWGIPKLLIRLTSDLDTLIQRDMLAMATAQNNCCDDCHSNLYDILSVL